MIQNLTNRKGFFRKYILPKTLYGRFVAIIIIPVIMVQVFTLWVFYDRHWQHTTREMSISIINDVRIIVDTYKQDPLLSESIAQTLALTYSYLNTPLASPSPASNDFTSSFFIKHYNASKIKDFDAIIRFKAPQSVQLILHNKTEQYIITFNEYRLYSNSTANLVWYWTVAIGLIFSSIALAIARNQARPIKKLSRSLIAFSQGNTEQVSTLEVRGSNEIRTAIYNFKIMAGRLTRQRKQRTNMLSGISHDLRTPLTRMKLLLAMMDAKDTKALKENIVDMERLIDAYLAFAKGEKNQKSQLVYLHDELKIIAEKWSITGHSVHLNIHQKASSKLRLVSIQRMLENIIVNATKYGDKVEINLCKEGSNAVITILDNGCGIPEEKLQDVFSPFVRVDESRNSKTGGVGLGLTVSLDVATSHGGTISLSNRTDAQGLKATITLPISIDA